MKAELIFIPSPGAGHLVSTVEVAKLLVGRDDRISVSIMIMKLPFDSGTEAFTQNLKKDASERLAFVNVPALDKTSMTELMSLPKMYFLEAFVERQQTQVRDLVTSILNRSESSKLCGFVIDMFCTSMIDVANEFKVPTYTFYTSSASFLSLKLHVQNLKDNESQDIYKYRGSNVELAVPGFSHPVPAKVLPSPMLTKDWSSLVIANARRLRETKAILVNTVWELEAYAIKSLADDQKVPHVYHVGPVIHIKGGEATTYNKTSEEAIITWLDSQPPSSVVFLCFGSMGSFDIEQLREIAHALEHSGHPFLWSLRLPSEDNNKLEMPKDVEDYNEVLPEGFLRRTSGIGKVIGWAPQVTILSHPAVGGFVSHCGWNSILESIWCGVPIATWPMYAEQQINAFELVVELGLAVEIKMDYRKEIFADIQSPAAVTAEEIERGIRCLMDGDNEVRKKMKEMKDVCRKATVLGGSSYNSLGKFIGDLIDNIAEGAELLIE